MTSAGLYGLPTLHPNTLGGYIHCHADLPKLFDDGAQMVGIGILNKNIALRDGGGHHKSSRLYPVRND